MSAAQGLRTLTYEIDSNKTKERDLLRIRKTAQIRTNARSATMVETMPPIWNAERCTDALEEATEDIELPFEITVHVLRIIADFVPYRKSIAPDSDRCRR